MMGYNSIQIKNRNRHLEIHSPIEFKKMKTPHSTKDKDVDAVKIMRNQRDKLSALLSDMSHAEIIIYFDRIKKESNVKPCS
jgi:hypothetical protein